MLVPFQTLVHGPWLKGIQFARCSTEKTDRMCVSVIDRFLMSYELAKTELESSQEIIG